MSDTIKQNNELHEEDLEAAAGGATQNRWNPEVCGKYAKVEYDCVGFQEFTWCDHYREKNLSPANTHAAEQRWQYSCVMGCYDYVGGYIA